MSADSAQRRKHRRVIRLSRADQQRLAAGEITDPTQAVYRSEEPGKDQAGERPSTAKVRAGTTGGKRRREKAVHYDRDDERILREVPPHFGKI